MTQYHFVIVKVWEWLLAVDVVITSVPPPFTDVSWASLMVKVCVCPEADDVSRDIPETGGVSTSAFVIVIVCVWLEAIEDTNVCEAVDGLEGDVVEFEQPHARIIAKHPRTPSESTCLSDIFFSFRGYYQGSMTLV
jgi:hypothetical protein